MSNIKRVITGSKFLQYFFFILCLVFGIIFATLSILRHEHFMTGSYDLAIYDQATWKYSQFKSPISTVRKINILGDHFSPILILLTPLFWLWNNVKILLIFQSMIVCLSAFLIYLVVQKIIKNKLSSFLISCSFFFFLGLQYALDYDFHLVSLSVFPLSLIFYGLFLDKHRAYWVGVLIALLLKEDLPVIIFFIGFYEILFLKKKKLGIKTITIALTSFFLITNFLMPVFQNNSTTVLEYINFYGLGQTRPEIIKTALLKPWLVINELINSPIKIKTFLLTVSSFTFLPILSPFFWIVSLPIWLERFLSYTTTRWQFNQYYGISLTPILVLSSAQAIVFLQKLVKKLSVSKEKTIMILSIIVIFYSLVMAKKHNAPIFRIIHRDYYSLNEKEKSAKEMIRMIPAKASVSAQQPLVSHLSRRKEIYWFPEKSKDVEYIALMKERPATPLSEIELKKWIDQLAENSDWELIYNKHDNYLWKRKK